MADQASPPSYSSSNNPPPAYDVPSAYTIGAHRITAPLVPIEHLKAHLGLLRIFKGLRTKIEAADTSLPQVAFTLDDPVQRWAWFVGLAVER